MLAVKTNPSFPLSLKKTLNTKVTTQAAVYLVKTLTVPCTCRYYLPEFFREVAVCVPTRSIVNLIKKSKVIRSNREK